MNLQPKVERSWARIRAVARNEVRTILRDALILSFVAGVPLVQLVLFGYAINQDVRGVPTAVVDQSRSTVSRQLVGELQATQTFEVITRATNERQGRALLERGRVQAVIVVPEDFDRAHYRGRGARVSVLVDASDPIRARAVRAAVGGLAERWERRVASFGSGTEGAASGRRMSQRDSGRVDPRPELLEERAFAFTVLTYYNPELRTPVFVVPGLLGVILTQTMVLMTALALVRERERGTFEFLIATPVKRFELMLGKVLPYVAIGLLQVAIIVVAGRILFRVPVQGSLAGLGLASLLFIAASLMLGLAISAASRTQTQATQMAFFVFLPSVLLSGFMFPFEAMPAPARLLGELLPITHYMRICRGILLRGAGLGDMIPSLVALLVFFFAGLALATRLFRKRLD